jgi:hypothetical protein
MNQSGSEIPSPFRNSQPKRVSLRHDAAQKPYPSSKRELEDNSKQVSQLASFTIRVRHPDLEHGERDH